MAIATTINTACELEVLDGGVQRIGLEEAGGVPAKLENVGRAS
jgi:hypothetical protein